MVELLKDFPPHVAAYKAKEAVNKEEYASIVIARVDEVADFRRQKNGFQNH